MPQYGLRRRPLNRLPLKSLAALPTHCRTAAQESARAVAEEAAREVSEGVSQRNVARGLEINRDELLKEIEIQVQRQTHEAIGLATGAPDFKQQIIQMVRGGISR